MSSYSLSPAAKADLFDIINYISVDSYDAAENVRLHMIEAMNRLAEFPDLGHVRDDLSTRRVRFWTVYSYLIVYRPDTRPVEVLRILHGSRDVQRILEDE